jgi:predicted nucleotidyltransferase
MNNIQSIQNKIVPILKQANIKKATLFGSYARGDNTEKSDIDILIAFPENATLLDLVRLERHLEENLSKNYK